MKNRQKLGQILVDRGEISPEILDESLQQQTTAPARRLLGEILIDSGYIDEQALFSALALQWGSSSHRLSTRPISTTVFLSFFRSSTCAAT